MYLAACAVCLSEPLGLMREDGGATFLTRKTTLLSFVKYTKITVVVNGQARSVFRIKAYLKKFPFYAKVVG